MKLGAVALPICYLKPGEFYLKNHLSSINDVTLEKQVLTSSKEAVAAVRG